MTNRITIVALRTTIAVLLTLNLVKGEQRADAGVQGAAELDVQPGGGEPYVVKLMPFGNDRHWRIWSDGQVDYMLGSDNDCDHTRLDDESYGPVDYPFPVVDAAFVHETSSPMLTFEDGRVDTLRLSHMRCTIGGIGTRSFCTADSDRNGEVNFDDLLRLLSQWGPCEG